MKKPTLDIVIVNWNAGQQLQDCVASMALAQTPTFLLNRIVIVDNASTDNSLQLLEPMPELPIKIIYNTENKGFGFACNQGAAESTSDYLLFLNPDTQLYADSLEKPLVFMENPAHKKIGILGVMLLDAEQNISRCCARFPNPRNFISQMLGLSNFAKNTFPSHVMTDWDHKDSRRVDHVMGAYFFMRKEVFDQVKGFDERYFVYLEDLDFSLSAKKLGWDSYYLADVKIYHKGGGTSDQIKARRLFYSLQSRIFYSYKHYNYMSATTVVYLTLMLEPVSRLVFAAWKRSSEQMRETLAGYCLLYKALPQIFKTIRSDYHR